MAADRSFIGRGWKYPIRFDTRTGGISKDQGAGLPQKRDRVRRSILFIIRLRKGTLYFLRRLGSRLGTLVFTLNTSNLSQRLNYETLSALEDPIWGEKRAFIDKVKVTPQNRTRPVAEIEVTFVLHASNEEGNVVYPFNLTGPERASAESLLGDS